MSLSDAHLQAIPSTVRTRARWIGWVRQFRDGRSTKVPVRLAPPYGGASVTRPGDWATFDATLPPLRAHAIAGPGFVLGEGIVGVDLDHCADASGTLSPHATAIIAALDSYTEWSPSRRGVHILCLGQLPPGRRRAGMVEMYDSDRFFTVTGDRVAGTGPELMSRTEALAALHAQIFPPPPPPVRTGQGVRSRSDRDLIDAAMAARNGERFAELWTGDTARYPSPSEADMALCNMLAFWTGCDARRIDTLFRQSGLMREKWDRLRGDKTYGAWTVAAACRGR